MGIVEAYLNTAVHTKRNELFQVTNPMKIDFDFFITVDEVDKNGVSAAPEKITLKAGETVTLPSDLAFYGGIELAKKICYLKNKAIRLSQDVWLPIAENLIKSNSAPKKKGAPKKTAGEAIQERIKDANIEEAKPSNPYEGLKWNELQSLAKDKGINIMRKGREDLEKELSKLPKSE